MSSVSPLPLVRLGGRPSSRLWASSSVPPSRASSNIRWAKSTICGSSSSVMPTSLGNALCPYGGMASADDVEDVLLQAVGVGLVLDQLKFLDVLVGGAEQPLAGAQQQGEHQQVIAVDQPRV